GGRRIDSGPSTPARGTVPTTPAVPRSNRGRNVALVAGAALAVAGGAAVLKFRRPSHDPSLALSSQAVTPRQRSVAEADQLVRRAASDSTTDSGAARDLLLQAIEIDPDNAEAHYR